MNHQLDICAVVERSRLGAFQILVLLQCFLCMVVDGFDIQAMAYAAPALIADWGPPLLILGLTPAMKRGVARAGMRQRREGGECRMAEPIADAERNDGDRRIDGGKKRRRRRCAGRGGS